MGRKFQLVRFFITLGFAMAAFLGTLSPAMADERGYRIGQTPDWVAPVPAFDPSLGTNATVAHGFHDRLSDIQINAINKGQRQVYNAVEYSLTNHFGVENFSDIEISFEPGYETLTLHELFIQRGTETINKLDSSRFDLLRTERDKAKLIYNGTVTLAVLMDDVRVGDTIRYAYTVDGENPVFQGHREFHINTELWTQLERQHVRILTRSDEALVRRVRGETPSISIKEQSGIQELVFDQHGVDQFKTENQVPSWRESQGTVVFSDMADWKAVADWARPLYQLPEFPSAAVISIASDIRAQTNDIDEQIGAALRWVQQEVRYLGIELGASSHHPSTPDLTLQRRFGDCKDKTLLLMAILRELGVESSAALVNTERGLEASDYPHRLNAFNHVLVHLQKDGQTHFIDPTKRSQSGALGELSEPNYGRALVLNAHAAALTPMDDSRSGIELSVKKELTLPEGFSDMMQVSMDDSVYDDGRAAGLTIVTRKKGLLAEQVRESLLVGGEGSLNKTYLDYYQVLFPSIAALDDVEYSESNENLTTSTEQYSIENFWEIEDRVGEHRWLYADEIISYLSVPKKTDNRRRAYEIPHPVNVMETWSVSLRDNVRMHAEEITIENDWLSFSKTTVIDDETNTATITFEYATLKNEVAAKELNEYALSVEDINDHASFYLQNVPMMAAASRAFPVTWNSKTVKFWVIFAGMIYFVGWWLHFMKRYRRTLDYYVD